MYPNTPPNGAGQAATTRQATVIPTYRGSMTVQGLGSAPAVFDRRTQAPLNIRAGSIDPTTGTIRQSSTDWLFNDQGVMNAGSQREAGANALYLYDRMAAGAVRPAYDVAGIFGTKDERPDPYEFNQRVAAAFRQPASEGFQIIGQELLGPIKTVIDYEGWARKVLFPRTVRQGEIVRYDKDVFVTAWIIGQDGETPESVQRVVYYFPNWKEVTAFPLIPLKDIFESQYDVLSRIQDRSRQSIEFQEDLGLVNLLAAAATEVNDVIALGTTLTIPSLEAMKLEVERHRLVVDKFLMNRQEMTDIIVTHAIGVSDNVDPVTQREYLTMGYAGSVLNCSIIVSAGTNTFEAVPPGTVYAVTAPEYLGGFPIRVELFSEPVNQFQQGLARRGWFWYELISQALFNSKAVSQGLK